mmetsp:Transcript_27181/g.89125  ORF Transcript_27181/g.89125 Transcript_27181/m.89125 type:complete len:233 (+) Transcript_27181:1933-2631(+)
MTLSTICPSFSPRSPCQTTRRPPTWALSKRSGLPAWWPREMSVMLSPNSEHRTSLSASRRARSHAMSATGPAVHTQSPALTMARTAPLCTFCDAEEEALKEGAVATDDDDEAEVVVSVSSEAVATEPTSMPASTTSARQPSGSGHSSRRSATSQSSPLRVPTHAAPFSPARTHDTHEGTSPGGSRTPRATCSPSVTLHTRTSPARSAIHTSPAVMSPAKASTLAPRQCSCTD